MRTTHVAGLVLWRGGLLLIASWGFFRTARWLIELIDVLPLALEIGVALVIGGLGMLFLSVLLERIHDYRAESGVAE